MREDVKPWLETVQYNRDGNTELRGLSVFGVTRFCALHALGEDSSLRIGKCHGALAWAGQWLFPRGCILHTRVRACLAR